MGRTLRFLVTIFVLLCVALPARAVQGAALERGAAIIDPPALRELDRGTFGLSGVLLPMKSSNAPLTNSRLFALPSMAPVRKALDDEFDRYISRHKADLPNETIGVGAAYDFQLFDRALLYSDHTRFVLAGIVNRMDRAYLSEANCGEIRLIYRLTRTDAPEAGDAAASSRLPMTLNVVLKAKSDRAIDGSGKAITCAEIARRWLAAGDLPLTGPELVEKLLGQGGPLALVRPENIGRIETNLQIAHAPKSPVRAFGATVTRCAILASLRDGNRPDYSRGFSSRPQTRGSAELAGTEYEDGWGAHCYARRGSAADNDRSFRSWACAEGLACQVAGQASRMGMCFVRDASKTALPVTR